jgi:DNA-binding CsgD family transcriptional regulator
MIASGKTAREIAEELFVSINTVYSHRLHILEKLNVKSNIELTQYAHRNKLVE